MLPSIRRHRVVRTLVSLTSLLYACSPSAPHSDSGGIDATAIDATTEAATDASPLRAPLVSLGFDAYRDWARLPYVRLGVRTYMRSTFDRAGGNEGADASHFLRFDDISHAVTLDVSGAGYLEFVRTNHWHGSPWHYVLDAHDVVVGEASTADPTHPIAGTFDPASVFPQPLAYTWATTQGADLSGVPLGFMQSLELAYGRTHYGTGYYIYTLVADPNDGLTHPITPWDGVSPPPQDVLDLVGRTGQDIAPTGTGVITTEGDFALSVAAPTLLADLTDGPRMLRVVRLTVPAANALAFAHARIRMTWDARGAPSVDAPVGLFFGTGSLYNRSNSADLVRAFVTSVHFDMATVNPTVTLSMYFPMPYLNRAHIELYGASEVVQGQFHIRSEPYLDPPSWVGLFHATYRDHGTPTPGRDLVFLDTTDTATEGGGDVCGALVGTSFVFSDQAYLGTLEGDPRFFFDDSASPQVQGTGSEEWGGGGDYWGGRTMTLPFYGHPVGAPSPSGVTDSEDLIESAYRFLVPDAMPFGRNVRVTFEHGGEDDSVEHYQSVTYWYGRPGACLSPTDTIVIGDAASETAHHYSSPDASAPEMLTSRYELGVDHANGVETVPTVSVMGRHTTGTSQFTVQIDAANAGVMLRRTLDLAYGDQRADVWIAPDTDGAAFTRVGTWYTSGSNQCVFSNPAGETDGPVFTAETSARRLRDDEFLIPARLTVGLSAIRVQVRFVAGAHPLFPGGPTPPNAWSELGYRAYSWIPPM